MKKITTADRLSQIMAERGLKQVDILERCKPYCEKFGVKLNKNDLSQYVSGKVVPKQDKLSILALALDVNEVWLMGYSLPQGRDELQQIESKLSQETQPLEVIQNQYGKEAVEALRLFVRLDTIDRGRIIGKIENMLDDPKYSSKEGLKDA